MLHFRPAKGGGDDDSDDEEGASRPKKQRRPKERKKIEKVTFLFILNLISEPCSCESNNSILITFISASA